MLHFSFQIILQDENHAIPEDYVALVPGQPMYVKTEWLNHVHATFRGKSKKVAIKNMMSGIYEPEDVQGHTATSLLATPVGRSLRGEFFGVGVIGVTFYIWHSMDVRAEWPPFSALPAI